MDQDPLIETKNAVGKCSEVQQRRNLVAALEQEDGYQRLHRFAQLMTESGCRVVSGQSETYCSTKKCGKPKGL